MATVKMGKGLLCSTEAEAEIIPVSQFYRPELIPEGHSYFLECAVDSLGQALGLPHLRALGISVVFKGSHGRVLARIVLTLFCPPLRSPSAFLWHSGTL